MYTIKNSIELSELVKVDLMLFSKRMWMKQANYCRKGYGLW